MTQGMCTVAQDELVILLECLPHESSIPRELFLHLSLIYDEAAEGKVNSPTPPPLNPKPCPTPDL